MFTRGDHTARLFRLRTGLLPVVIAASTVFGCGAPRKSGAGYQSYPEAAVVAGIAITAAVIQAARGSALTAPKKDTCCAVCNRCSFPCGDTCLTVGNICFKPVGCACYDFQMSGSPTPPPADPDMPCAPTSSSPNENPPTVVPMGVTF